jgi:putative hydrolase of the HAD superfamily
MAARALLLDIGVVFLKSAWEVADEFEDRYGLPRRTVPGRGPFDPGGDPMWQRHLAGELSEREYWLGNAEIAVRNGAPLNGHPHLMRSMFQTPGIIVHRPAAVELLRTARDAGVRTAMFTNELMDFQGREWVEAQDWFPLFDIVWDSSEVGVRKPDRQAYDLVLREVGLPGSECVFVDDNPRYIAAGQQVGMQCVLLDVLDPDAAFASAGSLLGLPQAQA